MFTLLQPGAQYSSPIAPEAGALVLVFALSSEFDVTDIWRHLTMSKVLAQTFLAVTRGPSISLFGQMSNIMYMSEKVCVKVIRIW